MGAARGSASQNLAVGIESCGQSKGLVLFIKWLSLQAYKPTSGSVFKPQAGEMPGSFSREMQMLTQSGFCPRICV